MSNCPPNPSDPDLLVRLEGSLALARLERTSDEASGEVGDMISALSSDLETAGQLAGDALEIESDSLDRDGYIRALLALHECDIYVRAAAERLRDPVMSLLLKEAALVSAVQVEAGRRGQRPTPDQQAPLARPESEFDDCDDSGS